MNRSSPQNSPFFSIIIPVKNEEAFIGNCLESLKRLDYPKDKFEIIISDGMSIDNTAEIAKRYGAKIVKNEAQTVAPGRNAGFRNSQGEFIAFSDADCTFDKNWLNNALNYFKDDKVGGVGGPNISPENETLFGRAVRLLFLMGSRASNSIYVTDSKEIKIVNNIPGCNAIYRREALEKVMPVDETLLTGDDVEMNYQLMKRGFKLLFAPDVVVCHYRRDNPGKFWKQIYRFAIGRLQLARRHKNTIGFFHIITGLALPVFILLMAVSFILKPVYFFFLIGAILILLAAFSASGLIREKSLRLAPNLFLATLIFIFAWSLGFLKELFFPVKEVTGK
jgi:cellulose synthase/poly-beta-1,6-N-acetylglucosamine synthase-like glycosyltransferase